jgi:hypothetical protein
MSAGRYVNTVKARNTESELSTMVLSGKSITRWHALKVLKFYYQWNSPQAITKKAK